MSDTLPRPTAAVQLETKIAFLERALEALNEVVLGQAGEIERLQARLAGFEARLATRTEAGATTEAIDLLDERPPHY
jgi:uncharacterized coiled-coil protein SlyX